MRIIKEVALLTLILIPRLSFANCPQPEDSWIIESGNPTASYKVNSPTGWQTIDPSHYPINGKGRVSFVGAMVFAVPSINPDPYKNLSVVTTACLYLVSNGIYGKFGIENNASYDTDLTKNPWAKDDNETVVAKFDCYTETGNVASCPFSGP